MPKVNDQVNAGTEHHGVPRVETKPSPKVSAVPCPTCECDGTIEGRKGRELQQTITSLQDALGSILDCGSLLTSCANCRNIARAALAKVNAPKQEK